MGGHVFITQGDLTRLACDAWLLPCDQTLGVEDYWFADADAALRAWADAVPQQAKPAGWAYDGVRVLLPTGWPLKGRQPLLVNVGLFTNTPATWYAEGVRQFLQACSSLLRNRGSAFRRSKPLVALPLVGTGYGGAAAIKGDVVQALLETLYTETARHDVDVVLITHSRPALAAAQYARKQYLAEHGGDERGWPELDERLCQEARALAAPAVRGRLVLFFGAGVGVGAGLPDWKGMILDLAREAAFTKQEQRALASGKLASSPLDQAAIIERRLIGQDQRLGEQVARRFDVSHYGLAHALLAPLPVSDAVTTNYDTLWELASAAIGRPVAAIPYEAAANGQRWLLKMHGCVRHPEDIVLTRESYLRYADQRSALAGIVQAMLITRHMLFVGFSLTDDNFHRIVDAVRKAIRTPAATARSEPLGTVLLLAEDPLMADLWRPDLRSVGMAPSLVSSRAPRADPASTLESFLDLLLTEATDSTAHLLDADYQAVLSAEDRQVRDALQLFARELARLPESCHESAAWDRISALFGALGSSVEQEAQAPKRRGLGGRADT